MNSRSGQAMLGHVQMLFPICTCLAKTIQARELQRVHEAKKRKKMMLVVLISLLYAVIQTLGVNNNRFCNTPAMGSPKRKAKNPLGVLEGPISCQGLRLPITSVEPDHLSTTLLYSRAVVNNTIVF